MKHLLVISTTMLLSTAAFACDNYVPYVGVDAKWNSMAYNNETGKNLIAKRNLGGNVFVGVKYNPYVGLELGYDMTTQKKKSGQTEVGQLFFGTPISAPRAYQSQTKTRIQGFNLNLVGFYPISQEYKLEVFGSVGLAHLKMKTQLDFNAVGNTDISHRTLSKTKIVPRLALGLQHMFMDNFGVRLLATWEKTSSFKRVKAKNSTLYATPKDRISAGLGVFYKFG